MHELSDEFRERLLDLEPVSPALKERYEKEVQAMFEKQLTRVQRWSWGLATAGSGCTAVFFGVLTVMLPRGVPLVARVSLALGALFALGFAVVGWRVFKRGAIKLKSEGAVYSGLAWGLPVMMVTLFMMFAPNDIMGLRMIVSGLVFLIGGAVFLLRFVVEQSELNTKEKLLEIEYRLAELSELSNVKGPRS